MVVRSAGGQKGEGQVDRAEMSEGVDVNKPPGSCWGRALREVMDLALRQEAGERRWRGENRTAPDWTGLDWIGTLLSPIRNLRQASHCALGLC